MKRKVYILIGGAVLCTAAAHAQQRISDNTAPAAINPNAILELQSNSKGLLYPRVALTDTALAAPLSAHVKGMMVYDTATSAATGITPGIYYNDGTRWVRVATANNAWLLTGNTGTTPPITTGTAVTGTNFWGTTDANNLAIGTNNTIRAIIDQNGNFSGGTGTSMLGNNNFMWGSNDTTVYNTQSNAVFGSMNNTGAYSTGYNLVSGYGNRIFGNYTFVGGVHNYAYFSTSSNLIAGEGNSVSNNNNVIGGEQNTIGSTGIGLGGNAIFGASNKDSAILGLISGLNNKIGTTANYSSVLGESLNMQGNHSVAVGLFNTDSSNNSFIAGSGNLTTAAATGSWAGGSGNSVSQPYSVVIGNSNIIGGTPGAPFYNENGYNAVFGNTNKSIGSYQNGGNLVSGFGNILYNGTNSIVAGQSNYDSSYSNAVFGNGNIVTPAASNTLVSGSNNYVTNPWNIVGGAGNTVKAPYSLVAGNGNYLLAGNGNTIMSGFGNRDSSSNTLIIGLGNTIGLANTNSAAVIGNYSATNNNTAFAVGNGTANTALSNAFTVNNNSGVVNVGIGLAAAAPITTLQVNGSVSAKIRAITTSATVADDDYTLIGTGTGTITLTLPAPATHSGMILYIKDVTNSGGSVTLSGNINSASVPAFTVGSGNQNTTQLQCDGTTWWVLVNN